MDASPELHVLEDEQDLAREAADLFVWLTEQAIGASGRFRVALSGGNTPRALHGALTKPEMRGHVKWPQVEFYFGDERCVPPAHPDSNFGMADETLFRPLGIPPEQVFRMMGEARPNEGVDQYERLLRSRFQSPAPGWPRFDLILLGLGEDGHTASLFPNAEALGEQTRAVVATRSPKGVADRLTLTFPVINHAAVVLFLVTGGRKAEMVRTILEDDRVEPVHYPAKLVRPVDGRLIWMLDRAAASRLIMARQRVVSEEE
jgi:6-phosphogluconolactonase